jgi:hypothetical protein
MGNACQPVCNLLLRLDCLALSYALPGLNFLAQLPTLGPRLSCEHYTIR